MSRVTRDFDPRQISPSSLSLHPSGWRGRIRTDMCVINNHVPCQVSPTTKMVAEVSLELTDDGL